MTEFTRLTTTVTKDEHDAVVARRGRNFTDYPMREARPVDNDATDSGLSMVDQAIADSRRADRTVRSGS